MCDEEEDLIRFHFGEMPKEEAERFRSRIENEPGLAEQLEKLQRCLESGSKERPAPNPIPMGLAERTSDSVGTHISESCCGDSPSGQSWCSFADVLMGAIAVGLLALIIAPALQSSRDAARRAACKENLHQIGQALIAYSIDHGGYFPRISPQSNAGAFSMQLVEAGYFGREDLSLLLLCPSSDLASDIADHRAVIIVPTTEEMRIAESTLLDRLRRFMGGSYAYRLGHVEEGSYVPVRNHSNCRSALLSDAPNAKSAASHHHGDCGQNILFQDGSVSFQCGCLAPCGSDHLFLNAIGEVAAGQTRDDTVLAPSGASLRPVRVLSLSGEPRASATGVIPEILSIEGKASATKNSGH